MHALIDGGLNLLHNHVFQFDFLNDILTLEEENAENEKRAKLKLPLIARKLPASLCEILDDPEKRKKLIVYINPPYAESGAGIGGGINKPKIVIQHNSHDFFLSSLGKASHELFSQFMARAYLLREIYLAVFSTLKYINSYNFQQFREFFKATFKKGFVCKANTFDNVSGNFPIGFLIWKLNNQKFPSKIKLDIYNADGTKYGAKFFFNGKKYINDWFRKIDADPKDKIAVLHAKGIDFQNNRGVWICIHPILGGGSHFIVTKQNIIETGIFLAVRHAIESTWLNDRDQFLFPNDGWKTDTEFQHNCLVFILFHGQNKISVKDGVNHWIPFTEKEVAAKEKFASNFMSSFLKGKTFSSEAQAVLSAGKALWKYFHKNTNAISVNASFYDIREFFQGRKDSGAMNAKSADETYTALLKTLRDALKALAKKIEPKVYEYGFLKE
jgi:hypothetical protein